MPRRRNRKVAGFKPHDPVSRERRLFALSKKLRSAARDDLCGRLLKLSEGGPVPALATRKDSK